MGFSSGSSQSNSQSNGYGYSLSNAISENASGQTIYGPQAAQLNNLYEKAGWQANNSWGDVANMRATNVLSQNVVGSGMGAMGEIATGGGPLSNFVAPNNELVQRQIGDLGQTMGDFFNQQLMPGITGSAIGAGGYGGGRNQIATGLAAGEVADAYQQGVTGIMSNAYNQALGAAGMQSQNQIAAQGALNQSAQSLTNLGLANLNSMWAPLQNYQGLLGAPITLGSSYGYSAANQQSENITSAKSSASSKQFSLSFM